MAVIIKLKDKCPSELKVTAEPSVCTKGLILSDTWTWAKGYQKKAEEDVAFSPPLAIH